MQTQLRAHRYPPGVTEKPTEEVPGVSQRRPWRTVVIAGLLAGAFDLTFAFVFYGRQGAHPERILRFIASGVLGPAAFTMGSWTVLLGAMLHFLIALCAAFVFYLASRPLPVLVRRPLWSGAAFGVAMYAAMHFVVVPLSRVQHYRQPPLNAVIGELFSHIFLFGIVIALGVARARGALPRSTLPGTHGVRT